MSLSRISALVIPLIALPAAAFAQAQPAIPVAPAAGGANTPVTKQELPALVKEVLLNDPEIVMEAVQKLREKQKVEADKKTREAIAANKDALYNDPSSPIIGNAKDADVTIVEFFDYHCGYCRHILPVITQIVKDDPKVRVIFKEYPILSDDSVVAARAAIAASRLSKDKYFAFHTGLMGVQGKYDEKAFIDIASKAGVDGAALIKEMAKDDVGVTLDKSRKLGEAIGVTGTPALIMNDHFLPGAMSLEDMKKMIANVRAGKDPEYVEPKPDDANKGAAAPSAAPTQPAAAPAAVAPAAGDAAKK